MKRTIIIAFGFAVLAHAQWTPSASGSVAAAAELNGKINHQEHAGAPGSSYRCTAGRDLYTNTSNGDLYKCAVTGNPGTWTLVTGGGGGGTWGSITGTLSSQTDLSVALGGKQATISGAPGTWPSTWAWTSLSGVPSTFAPINTGNWAGTWQTYAPSHFQAALTAYSTITALWTACSSGWLKFDGTCTTPSGGGTVTATGSPSSGQMTKFSGAASITTAVADTDYTKPAACQLLTNSGGTTTINFASGRCAVVTASGANPTIALSNPPDAGPYTLGFCNDSAARLWTLPVSLLQVGTPAVASACVYNAPIAYDGTNYQGPGSNETPSVIRLSAERSAPATPAAGTVVCWPDSTDHSGLECKANNSATVYRMVSPAIATAATASTLAERNSSGEVIAVNTPPTGDLPAFYSGSPAGSKCLHTSGTTGLVTEASADCGSGGGTTRTYPFVFQGTGQSGVSGFSFNLPATSAPTPTNSGGTMPIAVLEWPTAQSTYYAWATWVMPTGYVSNAAITYSMESRCKPGTCDSTHANIMTLGWACAAAAAADAPTVTNISPVNITNGAAAIRTITSGTITPTCAAGNRVWVRMILDTNTNSLTGPFDLLSASFSVQGGI